MGRYIRNPDEYREVFLVATAMIALGGVVIAALWWWRR